jgi:hypothetical protein
MTTITFSYKTTDFQTSGILCNNNIFYSKLSAFPLYNNLTDLTIIGRALLVDSVANTDTSSGVNEVGTYYLDGNQSISVDNNNIGYIYSFKSNNIFFNSSSIVTTSILFSSGIYIGKKGIITIYVIDNINRNVVITINN